MTFYSQRKSIKNEAVAFNNRTGERKAMLRQYFLYCASAATNEQENDYDFIEFGTIEQGMIKHEAFPQEKPEPEPEAEQDAE